MTKSMKHNRSAGLMSNSASMRLPDRDDLLQLGIDVGDIVAVDPAPEFIDNGFINPASP